MMFKRMMTPIIAALALLNGQAALSALSNAPLSAALTTDPSSQVLNQSSALDWQAEIALQSLTQLPAEAVVAPKVIHELETDRVALRTASLKVEESLLESLENLEGQFAHALPTSKLTKAFIAQLPKAHGDKEFQCLATALYFEARGESLGGQQAVAEVILNRVNSKRYPNTICGVVYQGTGKKHQCQFSFSCDGYADTVREHGAYEHVAKLARLMIDGLYSKNKITDGALFYHTTAVRPSWSRKLKPTAKYGVHIFYR